LAQAKSASGSACSSLRLGSRRSSRQELGEAMSEDEREKIAAFVADLSRLGQPACAAAIEGITDLLATAQVAEDHVRLRALADDVVRANGVLPLLFLVQSVEYDPRTLRPSKSNDRGAVALSEAAVDCCSLLCAAAVSALECAGWDLIEAPEDGRPAYLHKASNMIRNSAPDIAWPQAEGETGEGSKTWSQQLLLDMPTLVTPIEGASSREGAGRRRQQRQRGSLRWPVKVVVHEPGSHSILDVIVDGQADCLFRQLVRHDVAGAWRHTEGAAAVELELGAGSLPSPNADLLSWGKTSMATVPLLLRARGVPGQSATLPAAGEPPPRILVVGTTNCCDLLGFYARYLPSVTVDAVEAGDERAAKRLQHLSDHLGLPAARRDSVSPGCSSLVDALQSVSVGGEGARLPYDIVVADMASEAPCPPDALLRAATGLLGPGGLLGVGVGSDEDLAGGLRDAAKAAGLSVLASLADAGAREDNASAEAVLLLARSGERLKAEDISAQAWEAALSGGLGKMLAHRLPMKIDSAEEDTDGDEGDPADAAADSLGRLWLFWSEVEGEREERQAPAREVGEEDQAWDIFGGQEPEKLEHAEVTAQPAAQPEPDSPQYWLPLLPEPLRDRMAELLHGSAFDGGKRHVGDELEKPPGADLPLAVISGEMQTKLRELGYAVCPGPTGGGYSELVPSLLEAVVALGQHGMPPALVFMYDAAWEFVLRLWPIVETLLGGRCMLEPSFAAFRLDHSKSSANRRYVGNNFPKPHRDYSPSDAIDSATGALKVLSVWVPLNDITLRNGCMYVVPKAKDANFGDPIAREGLQEPVVPEDGVVPLAPHQAGSFMCWSGNTIHWGSTCEREGADDPRTSLAFVFRRCDCELSQTETSLTREDARVSLEEGCGLRLQRVASAVHFFGHWYPVPEALDRILSAGGSQQPRGRKRAYE